MAESRGEVGQLWWQVNRELHERFRRAIRELGLPPVAMILLRQIHDEPGVTVSELARRVGTAKSHVSNLVDQLVAQGYLEKRTDPTDQRLLRVYMTNAAISLKAKMDERAKAMWAEILAEMPDEQLALVVAGLRTLLAALEQSKGYASPE